VMRFCCRQRISLLTTITLCVSMVTAAETCTAGDRLEISFDSSTTKFGDRDADLAHYPNLEGGGASSIGWVNAWNGMGGVER